MQRSRFNWLRLIAVAAATLPVFSACTIPPRSEQEADTPQSTPKSDALDARLTHCRHVLPERAEAFTQCRRLWSENRRHFFGRDDVLPIAPSGGSIAPFAPEPAARTR
ncbi:putative entry exclusion protein TrbK-alt [Bradyrhizobium sp. SZCCHNRI3037]|uniref:putative entry exclusion protein TrbK-alt n=1 Tax=Bradyrhizobium sp. SZCCHNRI3037 TaxID=3057290 RepID=UPI003966F71F